MRRKALLAGLAAAALALSACASSDPAKNTTPAAPATGADQSGSEQSGSAPAAAGGDITVSFIHSKTGLLSVYTPPFVAGFEAGVKYATAGTNAVNGRPLKINYIDDAGDPNKAVTAFKDEVGKGSKIVIGTEDSGIAVQLAPLAEQNKVLYINGAAAADALTGINKHTFRSGRQSYQDVVTAGSFLEDPKGKKVLVFAQDTTFGKGNAAAVKAVLGGAGAEVSEILVPATATDLTPFALQVNDAKPDLVFTAWAGNTTPAMWQALEQQGVFNNTTVVTGLGNVASYPAYGPVASKISFLGHYFPGAGNNDVDKFMTENIAAAKLTDPQRGDVDIFSPDGFVMGQMLVHALEASPDDVDAMIKALEGWSFDGPKGKMTIRASDHALLQPMFQVKLTGSGDKWTPELVKALAPEATAPPEK